MMRVRRAEASDINAIRNLGEFVAEFAVNEETVNFWPENILRQAVDSNDVIFLVAEIDQQIIGFIITNLNFTLQKAMIENVYVRLEDREAGVGEKLLETLFTALETTPIEYVSTLVPADAEAAAGLYASSGFSKGKVFLWLDKSITNRFKV